MIIKKRNTTAEQSKKYLMESLWGLMQQKKYADITVTEIAENALLSRRTFYRIFDSKQQVLQQIFLKLCAEYTACFQIGQQYSLPQIINVFFTFWEQQLNFLRILQKNYLFYYLLEEFNTILPNIHSTIHQQNTPYLNETESHLAFYASSGALWNILGEWIKLDQRPRPVTIASQLLHALAVNVS